MISTGRLILMGAITALTALVPVGIMILLKRRGGRWRDFLAGAGTFFLFAMVLEQILHRAVLLSPLGPTLQGSVWLTALYGGLAAGIFEETGRFIAFKLVLRRRREPVTALSYGIGHGGCEAFLILGVTYISNIVFSLMVQNGAQLAPEILAALEPLATVPTAVFLWAGAERVSAAAFHMSMSVLVFAAATRPGKLWLFPLAILLHAAYDFLAVVCNAHLPIAAMEALFAVLSLAAALLAIRVYKNLQQNSENT